MLMLPESATLTRAAIMNQAAPIGYVSTGLKKSSIAIARWKRDTSLRRSGMNSTPGFQCPRRFLSLAVHNSLLAGTESASNHGQNIFGIETGFLARHLTI